MEEEVKVGKYRRVHTNRLEEMAENIKLAFVLVFKFFCLFLGNFQFSDQEKRYAYQLRQ